MNTLRDKAKQLPETPGVYVMKDAAGVEIYVGKAVNLRRRVQSYFQSRNRAGKDQALVDNISDFDFVETDSELEALLLESRIIKDLKPKYNAMLKNNEQYPLIEITWGEDFPRMLVTRQRRNKESRYFGPFVGSADVRATLALLQRIFKFRTCSRTLNASDKRLRYQRGCLNFHIARCSGPCCGRISKKEYRKRIKSLSRFLSGQKKDLIKDLHKEMKTSSEKLQFESASVIRDLIEALENINNTPALADALTPFVPEIDPAAGLRSLAGALGLKQPPKVIEGIDIANLQGGEMVGSLVYFVDGVPLKEGYRRYRIKTVKQQDDFACMAEVVRRRYSKLEDLPDILLIDGGRGQLSAAAEALRGIDVKLPTLMSLAKEEETPFVDGLSEPLTMSRRNPGLKLLMYVRDEAHRFAQHYHHILRRKAMFD